LLGCHVTSFNWCLHRHTARQQPSQAATEHSSNCWHDTTGHRLL
jgi:hypothetical protein